MGLFEKIFKPNRKELSEAQNTFQTLTAYQPVFRTWSGAIYESELVRLSIDARARHISKLKVELRGSGHPKLKNMMRYRPNPYQTWSQFLYRLSTILDVQNTAFIVPLTDRYGEITGYYPVLPTRCEIIEDKGIEYLRYTFLNGKKAAIELHRCGIMTKFQYKDDFFGESNNALNPTMDLIYTKDQGIKEGIKQSASFRFMARLTNFKDPDDLAEEQKHFSRTNLSSDAGGFLLFPNTYADIQQIKSTPFTIDAAQVKLIQTSVFNYFGVNDDIIQNKAMGDVLDGFYEGAIEPFAIQLSEVLTKMTYTETEQSYGNEVMVAANRLQYMKTSDKIAYVRDLGDRGYLTINEGRELLNYPPIEGEAGEARPIRGEYYDANKGKEDQVAEGSNEENGNQ